LILALAAVLSASITSAQEMRFVNQTTAAGFPVPNWPSPGGGQITWGDYNGDGYEDILIGCAYLYRNSGPPGYTFTQVLTLNGGNGGTWADIDNDGDLDIFCTSGVNSLWINNGDGTFANTTTSAGLLNQGCQAYEGSCGCTSADSWCPWTSWPFTGAAWGDYNADGFVDLYVGNYETWGPNNVLYCWPDFLYRNNGNGTFTNVSTASGIRDADGDGVVDEDYSTHPEEDRRCVRGVTWGDYNSDNRLDVYISNYRIMPNTLWENQGGGTFRNVADQKGCATADAVGDQGHTLGSDWGDMDNDGDLDLYTADLAHQVYWYAFGHDASALYRNNGAASGYNFTNIRPQSGMEQMSLSRNDWTETTPTWGDADNDGDLDIFVSQIYMYSNYTSKMYRNNGTSSGITTFSDMDDFYAQCPTDPKLSPTAGSHCLKTWYTFSAAWADYDNDGDLDLATSGSDYWVACEDSDGDSLGECQYRDMPEAQKPSCTISDPNTWCQPQYFHLYKNVSNNGNHWLELKLRGTKPGNNRAGIGARVTAIVGGTSMMREVSGGTGYHSTQNSLRVHFGLGSATVVNQLLVRWPDGTETTQNDVAADQVLEVTDNPCTLEVCNGRDDDCDSLVDEGFADADGDGSAFCVDCNDAAPTIHPGAPDSCDGVDQDCDGVDGTGHDADHDHYSTVCPPIDCNDTDPNVNPGRAEVPYNQVDDDCSAATRDDDLDQDGYFVLAANIPPVADLASGETAVTNGGITGSYIATHVADNVYEVVTEAVSGTGASKQSALEHRWTIPVSTGQAHVFKVEAFHSANSEGDDFVFAYSTDGTTFNTMLTVAKTADDNNAQSFTLPTSLSGNVTIRVLDADRTLRKTAVADTISIDRMWIETTPRSDCNDNDPLAFPGAAERCNGADDNCDGVADNGAGPPPATRGLASSSKADLVWTATPGGSAYDVVKGDLPALRSSGGDFTSSLLSCVENNSPDTSSTDPASPSIGGAYYYLVRTFGCAQNGTYDEGQPSQQGSRDGEIGASGVACP
jgi:hypothetical protein